MRCFEILPTVAVVMSGPGFGRGGRGAALLKLLEQPMRLPGQTQATPTQQGGSSPGSESSSVSSPPPLKPQVLWDRYIYECVGSIS